LSSSNRELLNLIKTHHPQSLTELAEISGRRKESLSRILRTMKDHGIVKLEIVKLEKGIRNSTVSSVLADSFKVAVFT
jgi:predicted transcriptional regulator